MTSQIFSYEKHPLRTETINNEPYFCLPDICIILDVKNSRQVLTRLDKNGVIQNDIIDNLGREQKTNFINEPNLYRVIFRSDKFEAKKFQDWVFNTVLPTIRKTGKYEICDNSKPEIEKLKEKIQLLEWFLRHNKKDLEYFSNRVNELETALITGGRK